MGLLRENSPKSHDFIRMRPFAEKMVAIRVYLFHIINFKLKLSMNEIKFDGLTSTVVERVVIGKNEGEHQLLLSSIVIGYVLAGEKRLSHSNGAILCREGELFILGPGIHYVENRVNERGLYEQITFSFDLITLQRVLCSLHVNYGIALSSHHLCSMCEGYNAISVKASEHLSEFFVAVNRSLLHSSLLKGRVGAHIKLNELIFLVFSGEDNCLRHKLLHLVNSEVRHFVRVVYDNLFNNISIEEFAELTHCSPTSFKLSFRQIFGKPPHCWIVEQRMLRARALLRTSQMTVLEIANACGFSNVSHFIKLFKRNFGATPHEYRRE